jgi:copper chaperone CopZ
MKRLAVSIFSVAALVFTAQADVTVKISEVHLCCKKCVTGAEKAVTKVDGATATVDKDAGTVTLTAADTATLQKAADALLAAGYFGKSGDSSVTLADHSGATGAKVQSLEISGVHLCCKKCVTAVDKALKSVSGVKSDTAEQGAKKFEVTGDFTDKDVFDALEKAGLTGKAEK